MNRNLAALCLTVIAALAGCQQVQIKTSHDKQANFAALKTYAWDPIKESGTQNRDYNGKTIAEYLTEAVDRELAQKGFVKTTAADPSFKVKAYTRIQYKRADVPEGDPGEIVQSRSEAAYDPVPAPPEGGDVPVEYAEGTIIIDAINPATQKSIWRGAAVGVLREQVEPEKRIERLDAQIHKMLADFPPK